MKYEITSNIDTEDGLTNGTECILQKIEYKPGTQKPSLLWMEFPDQNTGKLTRNTYRHFYKTDIDKSWTPIFAIPRTFITGRQFVHVKRLQFPITLGAARTIWKAQGTSADKIVVEMSPTRKIMHGHYVAYSRSRTLEGLHLLNLCEDKIATDERVSEEMKRLRSSKCLDLCFISPSTLCQSYFKIGFHNTRSLHAHIEDVKADHDLTALDIFAVAESRPAPEMMT